MENALLGPEIDASSLRELLTGSPGLRDAWADPTEVRETGNPLAAAHAYKHRLHAVRSECAENRLRLLETEEQLTAAHERIELLERRVAHLNAQLVEMRQSRAWIVAEKWSRWVGILLRKNRQRDYRL